ncbi:uracil-DNA glycosylase [Sphingorhabdus sp. EL138]|uniref:uracil-DNA glycosylase n=1 Tax=Sphingorhabdus sp. EL138 TaxID=2073156 RepID=UPI0025FF65F6|nr:uracil-DNA glycosylase [Sphingorhabdus sp. EL138]
MTTFALPQDWQTPLRAALVTPETLALQGFLDAELAAGKTIFPPQGAWFRALELTPLDKVRVVILGQDPYHGPGQAHGLCFSVPPDVRPPPSISYIYKELGSDLGLPRPQHGFLEHWAQQGVLLLNSVLTVEIAKAASHSKKGWEPFTDAIIAQVNDKAEPVVFMLWGAYAHKKAANVDSRRHLLLKAAHPSPLSAHNGFLGCKHFSQCNAFLVKNGFPPIDWTLPDVVA